MKKIAVFILIVLLFVSCASNKSIKREKNATSEKNVEYALHYAIAKAQSNAKSTLFEYIATEASFVPPEYSALNTNTVPGINTVLSYWKSYMKDFSLQLIQDLAPFMDSLIETLTFDDAISLLYGKDNSVTNLFFSKYKDEIFNELLSYMAKADYSQLEKAVQLYNSYAVVQNHFLKNSVKEIENLNLPEYFSKAMLDLYYSVLSSCEDYVRTTPDPFAESVVTKVFGNY